MKVWLNPHFRFLLLAIFVSLFCLMLLVVKSEIASLGVLILGIVTFVIGDKIVTKIESKGSAR